MSGELNNRDSNRYIPLDNLHPILKDLYSTSNQSSEFNISYDVSRNEPGNEDPMELEEELQQVDYVKGSRFPRRYNKRTRKNLNLTVNRLVEEVIRVAVEKLNSDPNSEVDEFFDAEENIGLAAPNNDSQPSIELVSHSSQTDLIVDPNEVLEIVDANDASSPGPNEEASYGNEQGGTGDMARNDRYCRVTTQCERCEVYMLNCYKYQCKCENLSIYSATLEKKVEEYVALLNNYNTRLMTSRLLIKQSNGKQNELMLRCDELQEKIRLHQALKEIEYRKKKMKGYYVNKFSENYFDIKDRPSIEDSELEIVKEMIEDDSLKDTFDKYKVIGGIEWVRLSLEKLATNLGDFEYLENIKLKEPKMDSSSTVDSQLTERSDKLVGSSDFAKSVASKMSEDLINGVISAAETKKIHDKYKSIQSIEWSNLSDERISMTLRDLSDLEAIEVIRSFAGSEPSDGEYHDIDAMSFFSKDGTSEKVTREHLFEDEHDQLEKVVSGETLASQTTKTDSKLSTTIKERQADSQYQRVIAEAETRPAIDKAPYEEDQVSEKETKETASKEYGVIDGMKPEKKIGEEELSQHSQEPVIEGSAIRDAYGFKEVAPHRDSFAAEEKKVTDGFEDDEVEKVKMQHEGRDKLRGAEKYPEQKIDIESTNAGLKEGTILAGESNILEQFIPKEPEKAVGEELKDKDLDSRPILQVYGDDDVGISGSYSGEKETAMISDKKTRDNEYGKNKLDNILPITGTERDKAEKIKTKDSREGMLDDNLAAGVTDRELDAIKAEKIKGEDDSLHPPSARQTTEKGKGLTKTGLAVQDESVRSDPSGRYVEETIDEFKSQKQAKLKHENKLHLDLGDSTSGEKSQIHDKIEEKEKDRVAKEWDEIVTDHKKKEPITEKARRDSTDKIHEKLIPPDITPEKFDRTDKTKSDQDNREEAVDLATSKSKQDVGEENYNPPPESQNESAYASEKSDSLKRDKGKMVDRPVEKDIVPRKIDERIDELASDLYKRKEPDYLITSEPKQVSKVRDMPVVESESPDESKARGIPKTDSKSMENKSNIDHDSEGKMIEKYLEDGRADSFLVQKSPSTTKHDIKQEVPIQKEGVDKTMKDDKLNKFIDSESSKEAKPEKEEKMEVKAVKKADESLNEKPLIERKLDKEPERKLDSEPGRKLDKETERELHKEQEIPTPKEREIKKSTVEYKRKDGSLDEKASHLKEREVEKPVKGGKAYDSLAEKTPIQTEIEKGAIQEGTEVDRTKKDRTVGDLSETNTVACAKAIDEIGAGKPVKDGKQGTADKRKSFETIPEKEQKVTTQKGKVADKSMKDQKPDESLLERKSFMGAQPVKEQNVTLPGDKEVERPKEDETADGKKSSIGAEDGIVKQETTQKKQIESYRDEKEPYYQNLMDKTMQEKLVNKGGMKDKREDLHKESLAVQDKGKTYSTSQQKIIDDPQPVEVQEREKDKTVNGENILDESVPQKFEPDKQVQQDIQKKGIPTKIEERSGVKAKDTSVREEMKDKEHVAKQENYMEAKQKAGDLFPNTSERIAGEKEMHPETDKTSKLQQDKQTVESGKQDESGAWALDQGARKVEENSKDQKEGKKEKIGQNEKPYLKEERIPTTDEAKSAIMSTKKQQRDTAPGSQQNNLLEQLEASDSMKKPIDEKKKAGKIDSIPTPTKTDINQDKSDLLPQKVEMSEKEPASFKKVLETRIGEEIAKPSVGQKVEEGKKLEMDDSSTKYGKREEAGDKDKAEIGKINIVSKDGFEETNEYHEKSQEDSAFNRINIAAQQSSKDDGVEKDDLPKEVHKILEHGKQITEKGDPLSKDKASALEKTLHDPKNKDYVIPSTDNTQDQNLGVEKRMNFPGQTRESERKQEGIKPEISIPTKKEEEKSRKLEQENMNNIEGLPSSSQKLKDKLEKDSKTVRDVEKSKELKQLSSEIDSITNKDSPTTVKKSSTSKQPDIDLTSKKLIHEENLIHQQHQLPSSEENKVMARLKGNQQIESTSIASENSQFVVKQKQEQGAQPHEKSKITERIKSIESQLFSKPSSSSAAKFSKKSAEKLVHGQSDDRLRDKLSATEKLSQKGSKFKDSDQLGTKQSKDNLSPRKSTDGIRADHKEDKKQSRAQPQKQEGADNKLDPSREQQKLTEARKPVKTRTSNTSDPRRSSLLSDQRFERSFQGKTQGSGVGGKEGKEDNGKKKKGKVDTDELISTKSSTMVEEEGYSGKPLRNGKTIPTKKEQGKADRPTGKSDTHPGKNKQTENRVDIDRLTKKYAPQSSEKRDQNISRKPQNEEKIISSDGVTKEKGIIPDYLKGEAGAGPKHEDTRAMRQPKITSQVNKDQKVDLKLRGSASEKVNPKEIAAPKAINGKVKKRAVQADSPDMKLSKSLPPQYSSGSEKPKIEESEKWNIKPTLLEKMKKYGINVLTWDELDKLHNEVLVALRAHHGLTDSETDESDIQNELQQLSPEDLGNLHSELSDFAENKRSRYKPLLSKSRSKILTQLAGDRAPSDRDNSDWERKPTEISPDIIPRVMKIEGVKIGALPRSSTTQKRMGAPLVRDQNTPTFRAGNINQPKTNSPGIEGPESLSPGNGDFMQGRRPRMGAASVRDQNTPTSRAANINQPKTNSPGIDIPESRRRGNDEFMPGRRLSKVLDRRVIQKKENILEKLQQYMNDQSFVEKPQLKKKPSHECDLGHTPQDSNKTCFCTH
ncbi:hypothetical protein LSTR_LSTR003991 [Laodelphax striatellus]|uniref:Uncharacterized protein n=1 Tax=Laodelphax striatellus TaxID=195883 RepID=A0A482WF95_LAOST|nr:hypothetical protein LSTR_LSTR003991 [Laodelphax striatellus]